jgi:hypothetical protein
MPDQGKSFSTIGIYLRHTRAIVNKAIEDGHVDKRMYPFGKRKYQIPTSRNIKKALVLEDIKKIFDYTPVSDSEAKHRDLWLFSYLANGMNVKDTIRLKYRNVDYHEKKLLP